MPGTTLFSIGEALIDMIPSRQAVPLGRSPLSAPG